MRKALLLALIAGGCYDASVAPECRIQCASDADCTDGLTCGPGGLCTGGENCLEPETCTPNEFIACVDSTAKSCNATGDGTADMTCASGCNTTERRCNDCVPNAMSCTGDMMTLQQCSADGRQQTVVETCAAACSPGDANIAPHCRYLEPAWLPNICDMPATTAAFAPNASATLSTSLDTNCDQIVVQMQNGAPVGPQICVIRAKTITIPQPITLTFDGNRAIALVADTQLTVNGTIDVSANGISSGPGVVRTTGTPESTNSGGGGGGYGTAGAGGGGGANIGAGGIGGGAIDPLTLAYFAGGSRAGSPSVGPGQVSFDPKGGGGGGGLTLIACRGNVTVTGVIDAGGGGGEGQRDTVAGAQIQLTRPAAGGGTGGYVVLQGLSMNMTGQIWANGGGGGGGSTSDESVGSGGIGGDGLRSTSQSLGGTASGGGGAGGRGSTGAIAATGGGGSSSSAQGGGGGGAGVIQFYTPMGVTPVVTGATTSPAPVPRRSSVLR